MVNAAAPTDRRERSRAGGSADHGVFGQGKLNPFGDLHTLQHLSARLARALRPVFEPMLRAEARCWAEPLAVQRFGDYRAERGDTLTAWLPLAIGPGGCAALLVLDGRFALELLDLFFGGTGQVALPLPADFSPAAEALVARIGDGVAPALRAAWEPLARLDFAPGRLEGGATPALPLDADEAAVVTRFGIAAGAGKPAFVDIVYSVAALKPHTGALTGKVVEKAEPDPAWRNRLTRAAMGVRFEVRSVLAEPVVPLQTLANLKPGDVIPISFGPDVPVMIGCNRLGAGTVGTSNGRAAVRLTRLEGLPS